MGLWFWVQIAVAAFTVVSTVKQKREFKKQQKKLNKNRGFEINRFGQDEPLYLVAGTRRVGPTFVYRGTTDTDDFDDIPNERYAALMAWTIGEAVDFKNVKFNDQSEDDWNLEYVWDWDGTFLLPGDPGARYQAYYYANTAGAQDNQTDAKVLAGRDNNTFLSVFKSPPIENSMPWLEFTDMVSDDMTGVEFNGLTFSTLRIFLNKDNRQLYSGGEPTITAEITGPKFLDPRTDTYIQSDNPVVLLWWYLLDGDIGKGLTESELNKQSFIDMANYCDELVTTPEGDRKRFTCNMVIDTSQTHKEIIDSILIGCHAQMMDADGKMRVDIDRPKSVVMHFDETDLVERLSTGVQSITDRFNEVIVRYTDKDDDFKETEVSFPDRNSALYTQWLDEDKGKQLIDELDVETITDHYEALRFAEYIAYKSRATLTATCAVGASGWQLEEGDVISITSTSRGWNAKPFIINGITLKANSVGLDLLEYDAQIYSYVAPSLRVAPATPSLKNPFTLQAPTNGQVADGPLLTSVTWDYPNNIFVTGFRLKLNDGTSTVYDEVIRSRRYEFNNLPQGTYSLEVAAVNSVTESEPLTINIDILQPATPTGLVVTDDHIEWQHPNLTNIKEFIIETTDTSNNDVVAYNQVPSGDTVQRLGVNGIKSGNYDVSIVAVGINGINSVAATLSNEQIDGATIGATIGVDLGGTFDESEVNARFGTDSITAQVVDVNSLLAQEAQITGKLEAGFISGTDYRLTVDQQGLAIKKNDGSKALETTGTSGAVYRGKFGNEVINSIDYFSPEIRGLIVNEIGTGGTGGVFDYTGLPYSLPTTTNPTGDLTVTITNGNTTDPTISVTIEDGGSYTGPSNQNYTAPSYQIVIKRGTTQIATLTVEGAAVNFQEPGGDWSCDFNISETVTHKDTGHSITEGGSQAYNVVINRVSGSSNAPKMTAYSVSQKVVGGGGQSGGNADYATNAGYADNAGLLNGFADTAFIKSAANNTLSGDNTFSGNNTFTATQNFSNGLQKGGVDVLNETELNASFGRYAAVGTWTAKQTFGDIHVNGTASFSLGEGFETRTDSNYFGTNLDGVIFRLKDTNGTNAQVDGGFVIEAHTPTDGITTELLRVRNNQFQYKNIDVALTGTSQTFTAQQNFTGGLQKSGVNVLNQTENDARYLGINAKAADSELLDGLDSTAYGRYGVSGTWTAQQTFSSTTIMTPNGDLIQDGGGNRVLHNGGYIVLGNLNKTTRIDGSVVLMQDATGEYTIAAIDKAQAWTAQQNFTGGLLKNGSDVIALGDLTLNSAATQELAAASMEQFEANKAAGLYDDYNSAEGSIAAGYINSIFGQFNYLTTQGANIEKLKSSVIEVSGAGYALNQNPTWQDSLDGWSLSSSGITATIEPASSGVMRLAHNQLRLNTTTNAREMFGESIPVAINDTYTISVGVYQSGTAKQYLAVAFYDANGDLINNSSTPTSDATGWAVGTYHYFGLINQAHPENQGWKKYEIKFGANGNASIPTGAVSCKLGMLVNYSGDVNTVVYLQNYRLEKAMGSVHIENGSITADHLVLSGNGSITFDTVGADAAGAAASAQSTAISTAASDATTKANAAETAANTYTQGYALAETDAGALAYKDNAGSTDIVDNAITSTKITSDAVTTSKIAANAVTANEIATNAVTTNKLTANAVTADKITSNAITASKIASNAVTANKIAANAVTADKIEVNALVGKTIYAVDIQGDANEFGEGDLGNQAITGTGTWNNLAQVAIPADSSLARELTVDPFLVTDGSGCSFELRVQYQPVQSGSSLAFSKSFLVASTKGSDALTTPVSITLPADGVNYWVIVRAKNNVGGQSPVATGNIRFNTRVVKGTLSVDIL